MTIEALADLLKMRGCNSVGYFHTDHFEPWSTSIDDVSARAVDRMAKMARTSPYSRRLSLFYNVFIPYRLESDGPLGEADLHAPGDRVVFIARSNSQERLARDVIRPLVTVDGHEIHLHVHHEFWTRNTSHFDHPVSRWVNECSTVAADRARLDLHFKLSKEAIAREIGRPFERWAFIHGNWALNASDPLICHVSDEMAMIMRHGGFGDFSFPAGRSNCDPKLERPFTCLTIDAPRAYDDPRADTKPVDAGTGALKPDRFFIWNSPIKAIHSSLDYYSAANRDFLKDPERVVAMWLHKSVLLGQRLLIKTHAHSMRTDYHFSESSAGIPHCHPDVVAVFDCLARVCDRAGLELQFQTVNEVMGFLSELDGGSRTPGHTASIAAPSISSVGSSDTTSKDELPTTTSREMAVEIATLHRAWMECGGAHFPVDDLYQAKVAVQTPLESYEIAIAEAIADRYPVGATRIVEIGSGWGGFAILMARLGFEVVGFEGNVRRYTACRWHFEQEIERFPGLHERLRLAPEGLFPEVFLEDMLANDKINLCIATNITSSYSATNQQAIIHAAAACDEFILDLARFGQARDTQPERESLFEMLRTTDFKPVERLYFEEPYEYWRFRSRAVFGAGRIPASVVVEAEMPRPEAVKVPGLALSASRFAAASPRGPLFSIVGDKQLTECPVCHSADIAPLWRMPVATLAEPIKVFGGYFNQIPTLQTPATMFCFDFCQDCESIFLNPVQSQEKASYRGTDHYIRKMRNAAEWKGYEEIYDSFVRWIPADATVMMDAACGVGQYLQVARRRGTHRWQKLIGLELAGKYVEHMRGEGLDAHVFDIDTDDLPSIVPAGSVDFISFCEGFEHVERPLDALRKLLVALRPEGRLFFTAQRYGEDVLAAVRPGEPIYIGEKLMRELPQRLGCRIVKITTSPARYYVVLEK